MASKGKKDKDKKAPKKVANQRIYAIFSTGDPDTGIWRLEGTAQASTREGAIDRFILSEGGAPTRDDIRGGTSVFFSAVPDSNWCPEDKPAKLETEERLVRG